MKTQTLGFPKFYPRMTVMGSSPLNLKLVLFKTQFKCPKRFEIASFLAMFKVTLL